MRKFYCVVLTVVCLYVEVGCPPNDTTPSKTATVK